MVSMDLASGPKHASVSRAEVLLRWSVLGITSATGLRSTPPPMSGIHLALLILSTAVPPTPRYGVSIYPTKETILTYLMPHQNPAYAHTRVGSTQGYLTAVSNILENVGNNLNGLTIQSQSNGVTVTKNRPLSRKSSTVGLSTVSVY